MFKLIKAPEEEAERKKAAKKAQKAEQKARKAALSSGDGKKEEQPIPDDDPTGIKALKTETPLEEALKLLKPLQKLAAGRIETQTLAYEIYIRQGLYLAALKALLAAKEIDSEDARLHSQIINFSRKSDLPTDVKAVVDVTLKDLIDVPVEEFNSTYLSRHSTSPRHILGAARGLYEIQQPSVDIASILSVLEKLTEQDVPPEISTFTDALALLKQAGASDEQMAVFQAKIKTRIPLAEMFAPIEERRKRRDEVMASEETA